MSGHKILFANFHCKFGHKDMLDGFEEVIRPAFREDQSKRQTDRASYLLKNTSIGYIAGETMDIPVVYGQFLKDTKLSRDQYLNENNEIVASEQSIQSTPSSFFVIRLHDHRMMFMGETRAAPSLSEFKSTMNFFLRRAHDEYLRQEQARLSALGVQANLGDIALDLRKPVLNINSLKNTESIESKIEQFSRLNTVTIRLNRKNGDFTTSDFIDPVNSLVEHLGADRAVIKAESRNGLDKNSASEIFQSFVEDASEELQLEGKDLDGNPLKVVDDDLAVKVHIESPPVRLIERARAINTRFEELVKTGTIILPPIVSDTLARVRSFIGSIRQ